MKGLIVAVMLIICQSAFASGEDLVNCRWQNGEPIKPKVCEILREDEAKRRAEQEQQKEMFRKFDEQRAADEAKKKIEEQERTQREERYRIEYEKQEVERKAMHDEWQKEQDDFERQERHKKAEKKKICGDDYHTPRIGMTLERAKQCVGNLSMTGQINRKDGVVTVYEIRGRLFMHVMDGLVVSWGRY